MPQMLIYSVRRSWFDRRASRPGYANAHNPAIVSWIRWSSDLHRSGYSNLPALLLITIMLLCLCIAPAFPYTEQATTQLARNLQSSLNQNPIYQENQKSGTTSWQSAALQQDSGQQSLPSALLRSDTPPNGGKSPTWKAPTISGYADQTSVNHGDTINLYVSTTQSDYSLEVYRMGWYKGSGARLILTVPDLPGQNQPIPVPQSGNGLIECSWNVSYRLQTASSWVSGVYLVKLTARYGAVGYIMFVLRADDTAADILYQIPVTTYQAYNDWGGKSLYDYNSTGGRAYKVSYDRPYDLGNGTGFFFAGDYGMVRWLESHNYNVTYVTSLDTQTNPLMYTNRKMFMSNWHDEYWSKEMRDNLTRALSQGENLAFFSGDNMSWQIRFEPSTKGIPDRVQVCYKYAPYDPLSTTEPGLTTVEWAGSLVNEPANALLGVMYRSSIAYGNSFPWVVTNAQHWIYQGTGLKDGDTIPGVVGYEYDSIWSNGLTPHGLIPLSNSPILDQYGKRSNANGTIYTTSNNTLVFSAGTIYWSWKLDDNTYQQHGADSRIQRMTANLLNAMTSGVYGSSGLSAKSQSLFSSNFFASLYANNRNLVIAGASFLVAIFVVLTWVVVHRRRVKRRDDFSEFYDPIDYIT